MKSNNTKPKRKHPNQEEGGVSQAVVYKYVKKGS